MQEPRGAGSEKQHISRPRYHLLALAKKQTCIAGEAHDMNAFNCPRRNYNLEGLSSAPAISGQRDQHHQ